MHLHIYSSYLFLENRKNIIFCKKKKHLIMILVAIMVLLILLNMYVCRSKIKISKQYQLKKRNPEPIFVDQLKRSRYLL